MMWGQHGFRTAQQPNGLPHGQLLSTSPAPFTVLGDNDSHESGRLTGEDACPVRPPRVSSTAGCPACQAINPGGHTLAPDVSPGPGLPVSRSSDAEAGDGWEGPGPPRAAFPPGRRVKAPHTQRVKGGSGEEIPRQRTVPGA